ncbi:hypothetical protein ACOMHN_008290 [Nucella lapillus]
MTDNSVKNCISNNTPQVDNHRANSKSGGTTGAEAMTDNSANSCVSNNTPQVDDHRANSKFIPEPGHQASPMTTEDICRQQGEQLEQKP